MKPQLQLTIRQKLKLTPQLQQAIRLLQLSSYELEQLIHAEIETNPLLECESHNTNSDLTQIDTNLEGIPKDFDDPKDLPHQGFDKDLSIDFIINNRNDDLYPTTFHKNHEFEKNDYTQFKTNTMSLHQYLLTEMGLKNFSPRDSVIAATLIDAIDDNGYLYVSLEEIKGCLNGKITRESERIPLDEFEIDEIEAVLHAIQQFEPTGVGARCLSECLNLQLNALPEKTPWLQPTKDLVVNYLELLGKRDYPQLRKYLGLSQKDLNSVLKLLRQLDPKPGAKMNNKHPDYIIPDVIVRHINNQWVVEINVHSLPKLRINTEYASFLKQKKQSAEGVIKLRQYLNEAEWFLKSINVRHETLVKVVQCIVEKQRNFFKYGETALQPLTLQTVAAEVKLHESTVSRITDNKYMMTPRGIFELKFFFSNSIKRREGELQSSASIRAHIKKLILKESQDKPLSDAEITQILASEKGIEVARRTVSKYRIALKIPTSHERRHCHHALTSFQYKEE